MITVLKHGNLYGISAGMERKFLCNHCDCVFIADNSEYDTIFVMGSPLTQIHCPECNCWCIDGELITPEVEEEEEAESAVTPSQDAAGE